MLISAKNSLTPCVLFLCVKITKTLPFPGHGSSNGKRRGNAITRYHPSRFEDLKGGYDDDSLNMEYGYNSGDRGYSGSWGSGYHHGLSTAYASKKDAPTIIVKIEGPSKTSAHDSSSGYIDI